jgi:hypothetical protein
MNNPLHRLMNILIVGMLMLLSLSTYAAEDSGSVPSKASSPYPAVLDASANGNVDTEPIKISSVYGTQTLKEYKLPFEDNYPSGSFEKLNKNQFLFQ